MDGELLSITPRPSLLPFCSLLYLYSGPPQVMQSGPLQYLETEPRLLKWGLKYIDSANVLPFPQRAGFDEDGVFLRFCHGCT